MTDANSQHADRRSRQWMERTVILKREDSGFGFTLTKEMPVFVDKVFNGGSAQKAGIQPNDRITKVNGVNVMSHKHQEVVDMIKDSSHVTLTVLGPSPAVNMHRSSFSSDSSANIEISPPRQLQELTLQSLKMMLHKQKKQYESLSVDYSKQRTEKLEKDLKECEGVIRILTLELASKSSSTIDSVMQSTSASVRALTPGKPRHVMEEKALRLLGLDSDFGLSLVKPSSPNKIQRTGSGDSSPRPYRSLTFSNGSISPNKAVLKSPLGKKIDMSEDDGSDEDLSDEVDGASESGPFSSLQELKGNPGHMSVFLHYLFMSKDPKHLLFYLVASSYQIHCKTVEMLKQRGADIYWTFFTDQAPLHLPVDEGIKTRIKTTLESEESDSKLKSVFVEARESLSASIITALANYRHKRVLGLASIFGDQYVTNNMPIAKQLDVVVNLLTQDLKACLDEKVTVTIQEHLKNQAIAACMATFLVDVLTAGNRLNAKVSSVVEKVQPFTRPDLLQKKGKSKKKIPSFSRNGHNFHLTAYKVRTACDVCHLPLWGVAYHGYQCSTCEVNIHKFCQNDVQDCSLQKKKLSMSRKMSTTTALRKIPVFQPSVPEETDGAKETSHTTSTEEEDRQISPVDSLTTSSAQGEDAEESTILRRSGTTSDGKHGGPRYSLPAAPIHSMGVSVDIDATADNKERQGQKAKIERTLSEKLQSKPDILGKQQQRNDSNTFSWSGSEALSDENQLSGGVKQGSSEQIHDNKQHILDEDMKELMDDSVEEELIPWALVARREVVQSMKRHEVTRQENIRELVYTERTHLHKLKIMKYMYKIPLQRQNILTAHQVEQLFPSLEELILFHSGLCADLKERVGSTPNQDSIVVNNIADVLLHRFDGAAGKRLCHACSVFASNQAKADKLTKEWKRKNERFRLFLKNTEMHPLCQRLTLTELMPIAWTRLTRYKLLIENVYHTYKKHWDNLQEEERIEANQVETAIGCVQGILKYVNKQVKKATNRQKLADYQNKMDVSGIDKAHHPGIQMFKQLDLTADNRMLVHEGPLTCRMQYRKVVDVHVLLLTDVLVLLEKHEDKDKFYLRAHTVESVGGAKEELSTVIRLKDCLLRTAAADRGGRTFLLVNNSNLMKFAQIYEFTAESPKEKKRWEESIQRAMMGNWSEASPDIPSSPTDEELGVPNPALTSMSGLDTRDQLNKIDDDIKKLMNHKLEILRAIQGGVLVRSSESTPRHTPVSHKDVPKAIVESSLEQTGEIISTISHIMVPNPTKTIVAETQARLKDIISELQRNLTRLMLVLKGDEYMDIRRMDSLDLTEDGSSDNLAGDSDNQLESSLVGADSSSMTGSLELVKTDTHKGMLFDIGEEDHEDKTQPELVPHLSTSSSDISRGNEDDDIVSPPEVFTSDNCATPTPGNITPVPRGGSDSGTSTPRYLDSPVLDALSTSTGGKVSPLAAHLMRADRLNESPNQTKVQSANISHSLHESHTPSSNNNNNSTSSITTSGTHSGTCSPSGDTISPASSETKLERTKLVIAPQDSPAALATERVLGLLSRNLNSKLPQSEVHSTSKGRNHSDGARQEDARKVTNQGNLAS